MEDQMTVLEVQEEKPAVYEKGPNPNAVAAIIARMAVWMEEQEAAKEAKS